MNGPCKGCAERHPACHSECEKYAEYKAGSVEAATRAFETLYDQRYYHLLTVVEMLPEEEAGKNDMA